MGLKKHQTRTTFTTTKYSVTVTYIKWSQRPHHCLWVDPWSCHSFPWIRGHSRLEPIRSSNLRPHIPSNNTIWRFHERTREPRITQMGHPQSKLETISIQTTRIISRRRRKQSISRMDECWFNDISAQFRPFSVLERLEIKPYWRLYIKG